MVNSQTHVVEETVNQKVQGNGNGKNIKEACPVCGRRTRYPEHPMCPECNNKYTEEVNSAGNGDIVVIITRMQYAISRGEITLEMLRNDLRALGKGLEEKQKPVWGKAHAKAVNDLREKGIVATDKKSYGKAVGEVFASLWNANPENSRLSKKVYGLKKRVESLEKFLSEAKQKEKENAAV